jgi:hypothetical protein
MAGSPSTPEGLGSLSGSGDIEAIAFVVMMEATRSAEQDLKTIMAEVKAMTAAKAKLRDLINTVNRDVAANAGCGDDWRTLDFFRGLGSEQAYHRAPPAGARPRRQGWCAPRAV